MDQNVRLSYPLTPAFFEANFAAERRAHHPACPRTAVRDLPKGLIPTKYFEALEHNQLISSCCRHPEDHDIEAFYSSAADRDRGIPDIYVFHCTCGRKHRRFCVGGSAGSGPGATPEERPFWEVR